MQQKTPVLNDIPLEAGLNPDSHPYDIMPGLSKRHPRFLLSICFGFAALFAELIFFASLYYSPQHDSMLRVGLAIATFIFSYIILLSSFTIPHRIFGPRFSQYSPIIFLMFEWASGVIITITGSLVLLVVGIFVVNGDLGAVGEILRSLSLYTLVVTILVQGAVLFCRYVRYLYEREMHQSYKIVTIAGVSAVALLVITLYLLPFDLGRIGSAVPNSDLLSLHISIRDVWLIAFSLYAYFWHISVLADH